MTTLNDITTAIPEEVEALTPYQLAGVASVLKGAYVREQMVYQYTLKGTIPTTTALKTKKDGTTRQVKAVKREDAIEWLAKYLKVTTEDSDVLESETSEA